jgi:pyruvate formate lyase activating enzyme
MVQSDLTTGRIFDIQGFSVHDGPGCRTLIFFKGCSLQCAWCSNPEGISFFPEPLYRPSRCTFDGLCQDACPYQAISAATRDEGNQLAFNRELCEKCSTYDCMKACLSGALNLGGYSVSVEELYARINRDRQYWGEGGGITLTGGEPLAQPEFAGAFLKRCYEAYIHTAIETCGNVPWENYQLAIPYIDWIFFDLKSLNESKFHRFTGSPTHQSHCPPVHLPTCPPAHRSSFSRILDNARRLAGEFSGRMIFRMPVVPGFNDDAENIGETARFIQSTGRSEINILPLHHLGREKYTLVGRNYYTTDFKIPGDEELREISNRFESFGIRCYTGSETPF